MPSFDPKLCRDVLVCKQLSELLRTQHVVTVRSSATVDQVLRVLASHKILSAPVMKVYKDEDTGALKERVSGFIDIRDVLSSFLQEIEMEKLKDAKMLKRMRVLEEKGQEFSMKPIKELKSLGSDGWFFDHEEAQRASVIEIIQDGFLKQGEVAEDGFGGSRKRHVVHRLALQGPDEHLTHIVSQSDVITFVYRHLNEFENLGNETAEDLGFVKGVQQVVTVSPECPALDAMILMEEKDISAVAVVNSVGAIIGNFSISELRNIMAEHFGSLALPVGEFLALEHGTEYAGYAITKDGSSPKAGAIPLGTSPGSIPSEAGFEFAHNRDLRRRESAPGHEVGQILITCRPNDPLSEIMKTIVQNRLHRVYVCSDDMVPCGVITLTDLLRKLTGR